MRQQGALVDLAQEGSTWNAPSVTLVTNTVAGSRFPSIRGSSWLLPTTSRQPRSDSFPTIYIHQLPYLRAQHFLELLAISSTIFSHR